MNNFKDKIVLFFATGTGLGYSPFASGTVGTLWGIPLAIVVDRLGPYGGLALLIVFLGFSVFISYKAIPILHSGDPKQVVIDEIIGYGVAFYLIPINAINLILVFILFRIFDILKPFPANWAESNLPGGWGIVMDDVMAGVYANFSCIAILYFWGDKFS